jgi:hypothetical protein
VTFKISDKERLAWLRKSGDSTLVDWIREQCNRAAR